MCGIAGIFGHGDATICQAMLSALVHRGPDDGHQVTGPDYSLGARRLSILDLAGGRQPVSNERGTIWAAQNGEIYNFPALRKKLLASGHQLRTHCDTETLPHLYEDHGTDLPKYIDGMFAVAVWDTREQTGLLARDRMGKKPLYYWMRDNTLFFASEIKALLRIPGIRPRLNLEGLHHYLSYKHVPHPLSIFQGISILPPAHLLVYQPGRPLQIRKYWDLEPTNDADVKESEEQLVERLLELLRQGVKRRLMSDVPIGFFLSGGIDSSLSTALAAEQAGGRIKTFTLTYAPDSTTKGKDEDQKWARWLARRYGTEHYEETIDFGDFPESFRSILRCFDEPFSGVVSTYFLARLIAREVKVALAGDGADELFGSYLSHRLAFPLANYEAFRKTGQAELIRPFEQRPDFLEPLAQLEDWAWRSKLFVFSEEEKRQLYAPQVVTATSEFSTPRHLQRAFQSPECRDPLNRILDAEFRGIFPDQVMTFVDRLSMAHSLEVRTAFLDTDVVKFVAALPGRLKIKGGETKYLLKLAARRYLPDEMVYRPKEGFVMPVNGWLVRRLQAYVRETLGPSQLAQHGLFNTEVVTQWIEEFYAGREQHANKILSLLAFQEWYQLYRPSLPG